jgi:hypothetical protein
MRPRNNVQGITIPTVEVSEQGIAKSDGVFQHGLEYWLRIVRVATDNSKHL